MFMLCENLLCACVSIIGPDQLAHSTFAQSDQQHRPRSACTWYICSVRSVPYEPPYEEKGFLHMRKQRRRSASR